VLMDDYLPPMSSGYKLDGQLNVLQLEASKLSWLNDMLRPRKCQDSLPKIYHVELYTTLE
jgi:hypothetical protein